MDKAFTLRQRVIALAWKMDRGGAVRVTATVSANVNGR